VSQFGEFVEEVGRLAPKLAVVLGTGLSSVPTPFTELAAISFADVPGSTAPSVHGHTGRISLGRIGQRPIVVFRGRLHYYEGHEWDRVARPIGLVAEFGIPNLLLTNAAGGIHPELNPGDLMVFSGHLFLQRRDRHDRNPVRNVYSAQLREIIQKDEAIKRGRILEGIYAAVTGPCYETPAEIRALRAMGADAVGMSTAYEAETAASLRIRVAAISCITNKAAGLAEGKLNHAEVLENATKPAERISEITENLCVRLC
jgi:purine-nucleoside phosphorylase